MPPACRSVVIASLGANRESPNGRPGFINGKSIQSMSGSLHAEAIAVRTGKIVFVGSNNTRRLTRARTSRVDLKGNTVVPGMTDSHYHLSGVGAREITLNLEGLASLEEFLAKVKEASRTCEVRRVGHGRGWIGLTWKPPVFPTRWDRGQDLSQQPRRPERADGHGMVVNSAALRLARSTTRRARRRRDHEGQTYRRA